MGLGSWLPLNFWVVFFMGLWKKSSEAWRLRRVGFDKLSHRISKLRSQNFGPCSATGLC